MFVTRAELMSRMEIVRASLESALTLVPLAESARVAGLSPCHFQRLFKTTYGVSPRKYQVRSRFAWATAQLQSGVQVGDVAARLGYSEASSFSRAYFAATGSRPGALR